MVQWWLGICFSYRDDLSSAGSSQAVSQAVAMLRTKAANLGLTLNTDGQSTVPGSAANQAQAQTARPYKDKSELVLAAGRSIVVDVSMRIVGL